MITYISKGDIFESKTDAWVNPVDLWGVMGKGLATDFKHEFPDNYKFYRNKGNKLETRLGKVELFEEKDGLKIINFPTKSSWKWDSKPEYIEMGLKDLVNVIKEQNIKSIAIPGLGCGLGSLDWDVVKPLIETYLNIEEFKDVNIEVYEPVIKFHGRKPVKKTVK